MNKLKENLSGTGLRSVFVANPTVLKGVTIGARSIIATGSVVSRDIPPDTLAEGIPARPIRTLNSKISGPRDPGFKDE
jgi:serine acetyltransferase